MTGVTRPLNRTFGSTELTALIANDWIFSDDRFSLSDGDDEDLLRFLTEMLHPAVRKESDSETLLERINPLLRADGYEIVPNGAISGRPTYGWRRVSVATTPHKHFTKDIQPLVSTVSELARQDGDELEQAVL
jgi:AbiJ N-terminal domain 3